MKHRSCEQTQEGFQSDTSTPAPTSNEPGPALLPRGARGVGQQETPQTSWSSETSFPIIIITIIITSAALKVFTFIEHLLCPGNCAESFIHPIINAHQRPHDRYCSHLHFTDEETEIKSG